MMHMPCEKENRFQIAGELADVIKSMLPIASQLGDATTGANLRRQEVRMRKGLVRVALIGATSSGKSTIANALVRQLVVPENPNVSSPIPVWISYHDEAAPRVEIFSREDGVQRFALPDFQRKYCYNVKDINDHDRTRFKDVDYGAIGVRSDFLAGGAVLIDTLGIAATAEDTGKTYAVLNEGVDLVVFVTQNNNLHLDEIAFLREAVLGYEPEKRKVNYPVAPNNLIVLYNNHSLLPPQVPGFLASLNPLFKGHEMPGDAMKEWTERNVFFIQGLYARMGRCGGVYPYTSCAPEGSTPQDILSLKKREAKEEKVFLAFGDAGEMVAESEIDGFEEGLRAHVARRGVGAESVVVRRIDELLHNLDAMRESANHRVEASQFDLNELQKLKSDLQEHFSTTSAVREEVRLAMNALRDDYVKGFKAIFNFVTTGITNQCTGAMLRMGAPQSFLSDFRYADFKKLSDEGKVEYLLPYTQQVVDMVFPICRDAVLKNLGETETGSGIKSPHEMLEESRGYIVRQGEALNNRIRALQDLGAEKTGLMLPRPQTVEAVFVSFQTALEQSILDAVSHGLTAGQRQFDEKRDVFISQCKGNFWQRIFPVFMTPQMFWGTLQTNLFTPLVQLLILNLTQIIDLENAGGIYPAINASYQSACDSITDAYVQIVTSLKASLKQSEEVINGASQAADALCAKMNATKAECVKMQDKLLLYRSELLKG